MLKPYNFSQHRLVTVLFISLVLLIMSGCSDDKATGGGGGFSMPPMPVEVASVKEQSVTDKFEAVGTIDAIEKVTIVSEIDGAIIDIPFEEGSFVKRGQLIAQLDDSQLAAEVLRTEALFAQSQSKYDRIKTIVEQKAGTPQDLDDALASLKVAEANLQLAKARLKKTRIVAPFEGTIGARKVSVGTFLRTGDAITELANLSEIRVIFSASESYLSQLKRGAEVTVSTTVYPGHEVKGKIIAIEPVLDSETRTAQIIARVQNPGQKFRSGMSANVAAVLSERPKALTIPTESIFASGNQSFVFIVNPDSTVNRVSVTTGLQMADVVEIVQGLKQGMEVVKAGHQKLFEGAKVMPITTDNKATIQK
ncbi:MAG: efflux RND transporter periplasmic adaptor subunit [Ignavibacteriaceae bacterium]